MGELFRDIHGNIPFTEMFRPISEDEMIHILDENGSEWKKFTATGYIRLSDNYFWPFHPNSSINGVFVPPPKK